MRRSVWVFAAFLLWGITFSSGDLALAQNSGQEKILRDISPQEITAILSAADLQSKITSGSKGEPLILVQQGQLKFIIRGIDCTTGPETRCTKVQFRASIGLDEYPSAAWMNDFNKKWIFGKAYVSDNGIANVEYPLNLSEGVTEANLLNNFILWSIILDTFIDHLDGGEIAPLM
jgi:hypothetical protein